MSLLSRAEKMKGISFFKFDVSEIEDKLVMNYPKIFKAADNDKDNMIFNRVMALIEA